MAQVLQDVRKRALADVSNAKSRPCKAGRPAEDSKPLTADTAAAQAAMAPGAVQSTSSVVIDTDVQAAKAVSRATQSDAEEASGTVPPCPGSPASDASCDTECDSPAEPDRCTSPSPPPCQAEQQSAYLLLKACEREDAAEERADAAEAALGEANRKLAATEAALAAAQTRLQLLEVQLLNRAVAATKLDAGRMADPASLPNSARSESLSDASDDTTADATDMTVQQSDDWPRCSFDWDSAQVESESVQLRLDLEATNARLCMSRESEQKAVAYANAAGERLDALAAMLRGSADIAFAGTDCSARRLRHHLFRCLDVDCDGFLGGGDLQHWYRISEQFLDTQGYDTVSFEALQAQLADALYNPTLPEEFQCKGKVSLMQLSRSKMGGGIIATLLNLDNLMQDRNTSEWGAARSVPLS